MNAPLKHPNLTTPSGRKIYESTARQSNEVAALLARRLREETRGEVLFTAADRGRYATDASIYQVMPEGVFLPRTETDVSLALAICRDLKVPIVPRGGGTSQCGQTVGAGLVIDFSKHMRQVLSLDLAQGRVTVEPGLVLDHLNAQLKSHGLWYPVDVSTSAQATLGGMAGNNSCGSRSIAYGNMVHNVEGASAWLADGTLLNFGRMESPSTSAGALELGHWLRELSGSLHDDIEACWPRVLRRVAGYNLDLFEPQSIRPYTRDGSVNLAHLLVGSEGTLALTRSLELRLSELPAHKVLGVVNFPSFYKAMDAAQHIVALNSDESLMAVELVDRTMIDLALQNPAFAPIIQTALIGRPEAILLVEFAGHDKAALQGHLKRLSDVMGELGLPDAVVCMTDAAMQRNLWEVRKAGLNIMMSLRGDGKPVSFIEDCAVPLEHLAEYTDALTEVFARHGTRGTWYAHASVGTLHVRPILDMRRDGAIKMRAVAEEASALVRRFKGAFSGEHGDGLCRGEWVRWQFGPRIDEAFAQIKQRMDPQGLLCPQRIVNPPKMDDTSLMRYAPSYRVLPIQPALDWQAWNVQNDPRTEQITSAGSGGDPAQGLAKAVEMCNNNGTCRKFDAGTMCPSYRITRDERHVTRGRANTLRLALSGQLDAAPEQGLLHPQVQAAMDLCVSCKGCKRECPTGVDMARMKIEVLYARAKRKGLSLRQKLVSRLPDYARWASRLAPLLNVRNRIPLLARWMELLTGIAAQRSLPAWSGRHFFAQAQKTASRQEVLQAPKGVVLFVDTFNAYFESAVVHSAIRVLQTAGYSVHIAARDEPGQAHLCCGRTHLAAGEVERAREKAGALIAHLAPLAQAGLPILGLEPSCLFTLRDEALTMGLGAQAQLVASRAMLLEEFLAQELAAGRLDGLRQRLQPQPKTLLVHAHCHQKAFGAVLPITQILSLIPRAKVVHVESSCCGMAGTFGYEAEHLEASMQMAELSLLPTIRAHPDAILIADGTSCRHQIKDGAGRQALHVAQVLDSLLM